MKIYLDLLPDNKKRELKRKKFFRTILREEFLFLFPLIALIAILGNVFYLINAQHNALVLLQSMDKDKDKFQQLTTYETKFSEANDNIKKLSKIQNSHLHWLNLFTELNVVIPEGISLNDIATKNYQIIITGKARSRNDLLTLKNNLLGNKCFQNVNMPLSDLVVKENVDFQMDFYITKDCLVK